MTNPYYWTEAEVEIIRQCVQSGKTAKQTMAFLPGRTEGAIRTKAAKEQMFFARATANPQPTVQPLIVPSRNYSNAFANWMGDPAPGRSALDQREGRG